MKAARRALTALLLSIALAPSHALAWNHKGHMAIAFIAWRELAPGERDRVFEILEAHPDFAAIRALAGSPRGADYRVLVFAHAARWPDLIRDDPRFYDETDPAATPTALLPGFPDMAKHRRWHFKDLGFTTDGTPFGPPDRVNAESAIRAARRSIADERAGASHRAYSLSWLLHLVGDAHQPLHCVSRYSRALARGDRGGNLVEVAPFRIPGASADVVNLHAFWDAVMGEETAPAAVRALAAEADRAAPPESALELDEGRWIAESFDHARTGAYAPIDGREPPVQLTEDYLRASRALALQRVKLAGRRLAAVISATLK